MKEAPTVLKRLAQQVEPVPGHPPDEQTTAVLNNYCGRFMPQITDKALPKANPPTFSLYHCTKRKLEFDVRDDKGVLVFGVCVEACLTDDDGMTVEVLFGSKYLKADRDGANQVAAAIRSTLQLASTHPAWEPPVLLSQAQSGDGIQELWSKIEEHREFLAATSELAERRTQRRKKEVMEAVEEEISRRLQALVQDDPGLISTLEEIASKKAEPYSSAIEFLQSHPSSAGWLGSPHPRNS